MEDNQVKKKIPISSPDITDLEIGNVLEVLKNRYLSRGQKLKEFEENIAKYIQIPYAVATNSGTSALHLVVRSLGLKEGDEVITTPFSFIASSNCLLMEKIKPVFVDINPLTYNIDYSLIEEKITPKTKAILSVDIFGHPCDIDEIKKIAKKHNLYMIEDACEAIGAEYRGVRIGKKAEATVFAFYPNKQITTGEGGIIITSNAKIAELCKSMRNHGDSGKGKWGSYDRLGYNYWMDEMSAALGVAQLERIQEILEKRKKVAEMYKQKLKDIEGIILPYEASNIKVSWFVFVIRVKEEIRDEVMDFLQKSGVDCREYFPTIHLTPFYRNEFGYKEGDFPVAEKISRQTIALPFYNNLKEEDINYIVEKLKEALNQQ